MPRASDERMITNLSKVMMIGLPVENANMTVSETAISMAAAAGVLLAA